MNLTLKKSVALVAFLAVSAGQCLFAQSGERPGDKGGDKTDPAKWHNEGIYYYNPKNANDPFLLIDPSTSNGKKSGGYGQHMASAWSGGLASSHEDAIIKGETSQTVIHDLNPVFYCYFEKDNINPKLFVLVQFIQKKGNRLLVVGSHNAYGSSQGVSEKQVVEFTYEKLSNGIFKVIPKEKLEDGGEYCFYYIGKAESNFAGGFYDFGIAK
jgi:hypothetical protein